MGIFCKALRRRDCTPKPQGFFIMTYAEKLKDPRWQKKRLLILKRDDFACQLCGDKETTLHVHHLSYGANPWDSRNKNLITYCEHCHSVVEFCKVNQLVAIPVKSYKKETESFFIIYVLAQNEQSRRFGIYLFEFQKFEKQIDFTGLILEELVEVINKEIVNRKKQPRTPVMANR